MNNNTMFFIMVIFVLSVFAGVGIASMFEADHGYYANSAVITAIDRPGDAVTCEDYNGFLWVFEGADDCSIGDGVSLVMDDNGTPSIFDDIIISTRYTAWNFSK